MILNGRTTHIRKFDQVELWLEGETVWYLHNDLWCLSGYKAADLNDDQRFITVDDADCEPVAKGIEICQNCVHANQGACCGGVR